MPTKPRKPTNPIEDVIRLLSEQVERMTEEEKAEVRYELSNGAQIPSHLRWIN
jgi:hypothetical protein